MKKLFFTFALVLGLSAAVSAQESGLFGYGPSKGNYEDYSTDYETRGVFNLPTTHGSDEDTPAAPLGTGTAILLGLGAAYLVSKNRKEE